MNRPTLEVADLFRRPTRSRERPCTRGDAWRVGGGTSSSSSDCDLVVSARPSAIPHDGRHRSSSRATHTRRRRVSGVVCLPADPHVSPPTAAPDPPTSPHPPATSGLFTHRQTRQSRAHHHTVVAPLRHSIPIGEHPGSGLGQYVFCPPARRTRIIFMASTRAPRRRPKNALH